MPTLVIKKIGGSQIGKVNQAPGGSILVKSDDAACEQALNLLFGTMATEPLELWSGHIAKAPDGVMKYVTVVRICHPGDDNYLYALANTIMHRQLSIAGHRIRGFVVEE